MSGTTVADTASTAPTTPVRRAGSCAAFAALFLIGTSAPAAAGLRDYPLLGGQAARFVLAGAVLLAALPARRSRGAVRVGKRDVLESALLGFLGIAGFNVCLVAASRYCDPTLVGTVLAATPVVLGVLDPLLHRRRPDPMIVAGCVVVTCATIAGSGWGTGSTTGIVLCLGALVCECAFSLLAAGLIYRLGTYRTTAYAVTAAAAQLTLVGIVFDGPSNFVRVPTAAELLSLLYMALVIGVAANLFWYAALPRIGAARASLFYGFTPLGALCAGLLLQASQPTTGHLLGILLVIAGLLIGLAPGRSRVRTRRAQHSP